MMNIQWSRIARTGLWLAVGILAGGVAAVRFPGESGPGHPLLVCLASSALVARQLLSHSGPGGILL